MKRKPSPAASRLASLKSPPKAKGAILFAGLAAATLPEPIFPAALVIERGKIAAIGPEAEVKRAWRGRAAIVDGRGFTVIPGLINAHSHAAMSFFRDRAHGREQMIERFFFPMEKKLSAELVEPLSYSYLHAGLLSGTTAFADHYYFSDSVASALARLGLRGAVGEAIADQGGPFPKERTWAKARDAIANWKHGDEIVPVVAPHAADTVSLGLLHEMASYARANHLPLHMHLAQTQGEVERVKRECNLSPVEKAESAGALGPRSLLVHMVAATAADLKRVAAGGSTVCLSPASQILYERLAPLDFFQAQKIRMALGTDCAASNDGADLFQEMRLTALLFNDRCGRTQGDFARDVFRMCTETPGEVLFAGKTGKLAAGLAADLAFLRNTLGNAPVADLFTNLVFSQSAANVAHVMVGGEWALWDRKPTLISTDRLARAYEKALREILKRAGLPKELAPLAVPLLP